MKHLLDLTIEEGGRLLTGLRTGAPVPSEPAELALLLYLRTLGDTVTEDGDDSLKLPTSTRLTEVDTLWTMGSGEPCSLLQLPSPAGPARRPVLSTDLRQWLGELLTTHQVAVWLGRGSSEAGKVRSQYEHELTEIWELLRAPRTVSDILRHTSGLVLLDASGRHASAVLRWLARRLAIIQLGMDLATLVEPALGWPGPLLLPFLIELRSFARTLETAPGDETPLLAYLLNQLGSPSTPALAHFLHWRLLGDSVILLLDSLDDVADAQRRSWVLQAVVHLRQRFPQTRIVLTSRGAVHREFLLARLDFHFAELLPESEASFT